MTKFIGRKKELESLKGLFQKKSSSLVVIRGRRRIGKSRLAEEYASSFNKAYNYLRFYLKYILPHKEQIETTQMQRLPQGWLSLMGLQFENLVVNNGPIICKSLGIPPEDLLIANPYFQTAGTRKKGCQIDYLIQTRFCCLYACEVKFRQTAIGTEVIEEVEEKLRRLKLPRGFSCRPVLIHVGGVTEDLIDKGYFARIIDLSDLLK